MAVVLRDRLDPKGIRRFANAKEVGEEDEDEANNISTSVNG